MPSVANPVNWFEIPVSDLNRAKTFYEQALGVTLVVHEMGRMRMAWFPVDEQGSGAPGTLVQGESYIPSHEGSVVYFSVEDIGAVLARVDANGGRTLHPKMGIGEFGFVAHFEDTEGNRVALHAKQ